MLKAVTLFLQTLLSYRRWRRVVSSKQSTESESISNELAVEIVEVVRPKGVQLGLQVVVGGVVRRAVVRHGGERLLLQTRGGGETARDGGVPTWWSRILLSFSRWYLVIVLGL